MIAQDGLSILGRASLMAAPKVALGQTIEEEEPAKDK
jgi:hypothetical protein